MNSIGSFRDPEAGNRIVPLWFWNGELTEAELKRQIEEMQAKGIGGFLIHPRQGMTVPYLSERWFELVRFAVEQAASCGMHVWIYDEYPYPSGIAGGEVLLEHPEAVHRLLRHTCLDVEGPSEIRVDLPWGTVASAVAVSLGEDGQPDWSYETSLLEFIGNHHSETVYQESGLTEYNRKRFFSYRPAKRLNWQAPEGKWRIVAIVHEELPDFKYYGSFVDPCHPEAVRTFIRLTHDRYEKAVGSHFGTTIKGVFTDEVGLLGELPWSSLVEAELKSSFDIELKERLTELYHRKPGSAEFRYAYFQSLHRLLRDNYYKQVHDWCEARGLQFIAEVPNLRMTTQLYSNIPGGDSGHEKIGKTLEEILDKYTANLRKNPKMMSSLARQLGRSRALVEAFHSVGWSMTLQDMKWIIDRLAALGVNMFNFHAFFYTIDGLTKHDAAPSQFLQNPYWPRFKELADYAARLSVVMGEGTARIRVAVLDPTTSLWTRLGNPLDGFAYGGEDPREREELQTLIDDWVHLCKSLVASQIDFDHLDPELLEKASIEDGTLLLGEARYEAILLPPLSNLEASAWESLKSFLRAGGIVIASGLLPYEEIEAGSPVTREIAEWFGLVGDETCRDYWGLPSAIVRQSDSDNPTAEWRQGKLSAYFLRMEGSLSKESFGQTVARKLNELLPPKLRLIGEDEARRSMLVQQREMPDGSEIVFVSHQESGPKRVMLEIGGPTPDWDVKRLIPETGEWLPMATERTGTTLRIPHAFVSFESLLLRLSPASNGLAAEASTAMREMPAALSLPSEPSAWTIRAERDNALRFGDYRFRFKPDGGERWSDWHLGHAKPFSNLIDDLSRERQDLAVPVRFSRTFGTPLRAELRYPIACEFEADFEIEALPRECRLLLESGSLSGVYAIELNGNEIPQESLIPSPYYDAFNLGCDALSQLKLGPNTLTIRLTASKPWDGFVEPLYLVGDFGVVPARGSSPAKMTAPVATASPAPWGFDGYPYYAGTLSLRTALPAPSYSDEGIALRLPAFLAERYECAELLANGQTLGVRGWAPYEWSVPPELLRPNSALDIELKLTNTLAGMLEGTYFDSRKHQIVPIGGGI